jgi:hypothetical protein
VKGNFRGGESLEGNLRRGIFREESSEGNLWRGIFRGEFSFRSIFGERSPTSILSLLD